MSFTNPPDWSSGKITAATMALAVMAVPLSCLMAMEALIVFGPWDGQTLVIRLISLFSPVYVFVCIGLVRKLNSEGKYRRALGLLLALGLPLSSVLASLTFVIVTS